MYCVKCGRQCEKTLRRCPDCGMRLVTPAKLKELIELERITNMTFAGRLRAYFKRFKKRLRRRGSALGETVSQFFSKLSVDLIALFKLLGRIFSAGGSALWAFLKRAWAFLKQAAVAAYRRFKPWFKRLRKRVSRKIQELKQQYRQEREAQQSRAASKSARPAARSQSARTSEARNVARRAGTAAAVHPARTGTAHRKPAGKPQTRSQQRDRWFASEGESYAAHRTQNVRRSTGSKGRPPAKGKAKAGSSLARVFTASWAQEHLRSLVAMGLLLLALIVFCFWGAFSDSGQKSLAQIGLGSARGYMLIGDDYLKENNYSRAVEYYYTSLTKELSYDAALKLAIAYSYTGDISKEISALLICTENYPQNKLPFTQLYQLYPEGTECPARVQQAIEQGLRLYGSL